MAYASHDAGLRELIYLLSMAECVPLLGFWDACSQRLLRGVEPRVLKAYA